MERRLHDSCCPIHTKGKVGANRQKEKRLLLRSGSGGAAEQSIRCVCERERGNLNSHHGAGIQRRQLGRVMVVYCDQEGPLDGGRGRSAGLPRGPAWGPTVGLPGKSLRFGVWREEAGIGLRRTGKSCRLRWVNYLHPDLKRGRLKPEEERRVIELHAIWGNRWSRIAKCLPGRTDNEIKNYWRTHMRKKAQEQRRKLAAGAAATTNATDVNSSGASHSCSSSTLSYSGSSNSIDCMFHPQLAAHELLPHLQLQNSDATGWPVVSGCGVEVDDVAGSWVGLQACWDDAGWGSPGCSGNDSYQKQSMPVSGILNDHGAAANHSFCPPTSEQALVMPPPPSPLWEYSTHPIWKLLNEDDHDGLIFPSSCWN